MQTDVSASVIFFFLQFLSVYIYIHRNYLCFDKSQQRDNKQLPEIVPHLGCQMFLPLRTSVVKLFEGLFWAGTRSEFDVCNIGLPEVGLL